MSLQGICLSESYAWDWDREPLHLSFSQHSLSFRPSQLSSSCIQLSLKPIASFRYLLSTLDVLHTLPDIVVAMLNMRHPPLHIYWGGGALGDYCKNMCFVVSVLGKRQVFLVTYKKTIDLGWQMGFQGTFLEEEKPLVFSDSTPKPWVVNVLFISYWTHCIGTSWELRHLGALVPNNFHMIPKREFKSVASLSFSEYKKISLLVYIWNGTAHRRHVPLGHSEHFLNRGANKENSCSPQSFDTSGLSN